MGPTPTPLENPQVFLMGIKKTRGNQYFYFLSYKGINNIDLNI